MILEPLFAASAGGWDVGVLIGVVSLLGLVAVASLVVIAVVVFRRGRSRKPGSPGAHSPPLH